MSIQTNLAGRLRNTSLPYNHGLMPLFEAIINSIHSIEELNENFKKHLISVEINRSTQTSLELDDAKENNDVIDSFTITDTGIGFNDDNFTSFKLLDTDHKALKGCRGVGRLLWLKAFNKVVIDSTYLLNGEYKRRKFNFTVKNGVSKPEEQAILQAKHKTSVSLIGLEKSYRTASPKTLKSIAKSILEHCMWYFVREGGVPKIIVIDGNEKIDLDALYEDYMHASAVSESIQIKDKIFEITHIKLRTSTNKNHTISLCAADRLVKEENITGKILGLSNKISDQNGEFIYACYLSSDYLTEKVRSERTGFNLEETTDGFFAKEEISLKDIRENLYPKISEFLAESLNTNIIAGKERLDSFISDKAPRYRPIISRIPEDQKYIDPNLTDKELDLHLHKQLYEVERNILDRGHNILQPHFGENAEVYNNRVKEYLDAVSDIKKSDLANYLCHRRVIIDLLENAIRQKENGDYSTEDIIHKLIIPKGVESNELFVGDCNLWLIDEKLVFHDYLASDKSIRSMPISGNNTGKEPDIIALNVYDNPILMSESQNLPLASITVVELKRPMRNDATAGEDKDPIEQSISYLNRIRKGNAKTANGRLIPNSDNIPGYCYVVADLTDTVKKRCEILNLTPTSDFMGYFGYNTNYKAYIEVISFDKLVDSAKKRNKAFFDKLGLPSN